MRFTRTSAVAAIMAALALALAATAVALTPKPGSYSNGSDQHNVTFAVDGGDILQFVASDSACGGGKPAIIKKINIKSSGKFHYDGKATGTLTGEAWHAEVTGRFVSKKKAKGTFEREGCDARKFTVKSVDAG
jgi:hypothetical protein